jgi:acyl carrier protein
VNLYGSTETQRAVGHFVVSGAEGEGTPNLDRKEVLPLGRGMKDVQLLVLNPDKQLAGIGEIGEIFVRSPHLAKGYLGDEAGTHERFINNPFSNQAGDRLYKTGDLGRCLPNGDVEFVGRKDNQVKVRGFRIELGEIETVLAKHPNIQEAVVIARSVNNNTQLVAYYVTGDKDKTLEANETRIYLKDKLPEYMIPAAFVSLEAIPLTPNRKIDRKALKDREVELESSQEYVAPRTETEKQLAGIWEEVLGVEKVGIYDNFFELGGHSLLAIQMVTKIRERLGVECPLKNIFDHATVFQLAKLFPALAGIHADNIILGSIPRNNKNRNTPIPLGNSQLLFWFLWQSQKETANVSVTYDVKGPIDSHRLEQAFNVLLQRHESIWVRFHSHRPLQEIIPPKHTPLSIRDLRSLDPQEKEENLKNARSELINKMFDITSPPLIRLCLIQLEEHQYKLLLVTPHIVADPEVMHTLVQELMNLYLALLSSQPLPPKQTDVHISDFVYWEYEVIKQVHQKEVNYWRRKLEGATFLYVPDSYLLPIGGTTSPRCIIQLDNTLLDKLSNISQQHKVSLQMSLTAVIAIVLHRFTSQSDICIQTIFENRMHQELKNLVTSLISAVPLRIQISQEASFPDLVTQIKHTTLESYEHSRDTVTIPMWFLFQHLFQGHNSLVFAIKKLTLRFFTWLLTRVWFPHKAYPTMFYSALVYMARKLHLKNKPPGKVRGSKSNTSTPRQGIDVMVNFLPNFYQNPGTNNYICGDVSFSPGKIPSHGKINEAMEYGLTNSLVIEFVRIKGEPLLQLTGVRFTPSALQQLTSSFEEVLEAVVKNPQINLLDITNRSS